MDFKLLKTKANIRLPSQCAEHVGNCRCAITSFIGTGSRKQKKKIDEMYLDSPSFQFSSVTQSCPTLCDPVNHSTPGLPVHHQLLESTQTHVR